MTKLEQKLIELGYDVSQDTNGVFTAAKIDFSDGNELVIKIYEDKIIDYYIFSLTRRFQRKKQLDNLQNTFNQLQSDLTVIEFLLD